MTAPLPSGNTYLDIVNAATNAISYAWHNKAATVFAIVLAGGGWTIYQQGTSIVDGVVQLKSITRPAPEVEAGRAAGEQTANAHLVPAFEEVRTQIDADRVVLYLGHNNASGLGGDHWLFWDLRQAAVGDGVAISEADEVNLRSSLWSTVEGRVNPINAPAAGAKFRVEDIPSSSLRNRLRAAGTTLIYAYGVKDAAGVPRGFIVASYMKRAPAAPDKTVFAALSELAGEVNRAANDQARIKALTQAGRP